MLIIFDLDGTLADIGPRLNKAGKQPCRLSNPAAFQQWLDEVQDDKSLSEDLPISEVLTVYHALKQTAHTTVFLTGRSEKYKGVTQKWMKNWRLVGNLYMRRADDHRKPADMKKDYIIEILKEYNPQTVLAIDDDPEGCTTKVYSELGILHLKVMDRVGNLSSIKRLNNGKN